MFENNKHILNDIDYRENTLYLKLKSYSERGLPSNVDIEKISTYDYLQRFEYFSLLEKRQKEIAIKLEQKEKEEKKEQQKDKNKVILKLLKRMKMMKKLLKIKISFMKKKKLFRYTNISK